MRIKKQNISTNWDWGKIETGEVLIISKEYSDIKIAVLVVGATGEILNALEIDDVGVSNRLIVLDLKDDELFLIKTDDYIIISRFKEAELDLGEEYI